MPEREERLRELPTPILKLLVAQTGVEADRQSRPSMIRALADCDALTTRLIHAVVETVRSAPAAPPSPSAAAPTPRTPAARAASQAPTSLTRSDASPDAFVAIDFETANPSRDSACSVGLVRVEGGRVAAEEYRLIRPPTPWFAPMNASVHHITWRDVADQPDFETVWGQVQPILRGARVFVAHNAPFDRSVLQRCCARYDLPCPPLPFECTLRLARRTWELPAYRLATVCDALGIPLNHHHALSDARACAAIYLRAGAAVPA